jgi:hypothetical protein
MSNNHRDPVAAPITAGYGVGRTPYYLYNITIFTVFQPSPVPYLPHKAKRHLNEDCSVRSPHDSQTNGGGVDGPSSTGSVPHQVHHADDGTAAQPRMRPITWQVVHETTRGWPTSQTRE